MNAVNTKNEYRFSIEAAVGHDGVVLESALHLIEHAIEKGFDGSVSAIVIEQRFVPEVMASIPDRLYIETFATIVRWRLVLQQIQKSRVPWFFIGSGPTLGVLFELACACHFRVFTDELVLVGFPDMLVGDFPFGLNATMMPLKNTRVREYLEKHPVLSARDAYHIGLVDVLCLGGDGVRLSEQFIGQKTRVLGKESKVKKLSQPHLTEAELIKIEFDQQSLLAQQGKLDSVYTKCLHILEKKGAFRKSADPDVLIGIVAARRLLNPKHQRLRKTGDCDVPPSIMRRVETSDTFYIDTEGVLPPTAVFAALLEGSCQVVLYASENAKIVTALNLLYHRLERLKGAKNASKIWEKKLQWVVSEHRPRSGAMLHWTHADELYIEINGRRAICYCVGGNHQEANRSVVEILQVDSGLGDENRFGYILSLVGERVWHGEHGQGYAVVLRNMFFAELMRLTRASGRDLSAILALLRKDGWGFAGDEEFWDRFLRSRQEAVLTHGEDAIRGGKDPGGGEIGSIRHARAISRKPEGAMAKAWCGARLSQHLALFIGVVVAGITNESHIDWLAAKTLGFPLKYGTPLTYLQGRGRSRVRAYVVSEWPDFMPSIES